MTISVVHLLSAASLLSHQKPKTHDGVGRDGQLTTRTRPLAECFDGRHC